MAQSYLEYVFKVHPLQPASEILIAELAALGFDSFVETETGVLAYIPKEMGPAELDAVGALSHQEFEISYEVREIAPVNWNQAWEENFEPIIVDNSCVIRAPFHPATDAPYEIVIEPKMSFGTGHHETTHMMVQFLLKAEVQDKAVLDMGCGTGVLAILASMRGARQVTAIDIDEWSYENTLENADRNKRKNITVYKGDASLLPGRRFDLVLANINRNVLLMDIPQYVDCLEQPGGILIVSGFYQEDLLLISEKCSALGMRISEKLKKGDWVSAKYVF